MVIFWNFFLISTNFLFFCVIIVFSPPKMRKRGVILEKLGTITVSVFKNAENVTDFCIETDNDNVLPVSYVIEDTLKLY